MSQFIPERSEINPKWFEAWGKKFGASELGTLMSKNDRVFARVRERMFVSLGIDQNAEFDDDDVIVAHAFAHDRERLTRLCGMVMHGGIFRNCISKAEFGQIAKLFPLDDMKLAVSLRHHHPDEENFNLDMSKLNELIERSGAACLAGWKAGLNEQLGMRIHLMETDENEEQDQTQTVDEGVAWSLAVAVAQAMLDESQSLAA